MSTAAQRRNAKKRGLSAAQQVDAAVAEYQASLSEEARGAEAQEARALVQGLLAGSMLQLRASGAMGIVDVEIEKGDDGIYLNHFAVVMRSGHRMKVTVEVE